MERVELEKNDPEAPMNACGVEKQTSKGHSTPMNQQFQETLSTNQNSSPLDAALQYRRRGWSIIPVIEKRAAGTWRPFQDQLADENTLRRLFRRPGITGLAVVLGAVSGGLACRDFDDADSYRNWAAENPTDAATLPTAETARGYHVYGRLDTEAFSTFADGELRADSRHYTVLPPAVHPSGFVYHWLNPLPEIGESLNALPVSLVSNVDAKNTRQPKTTQANPLHRYHSPLSESEICELITGFLPSGFGQRNRKLFDLARFLKSIVSGDDTTELRAIVRSWHRLALASIRTKDFSESWSDFVIAWQNIKHPIGVSWSKAVADADKDEPDIAQDYDGNLRRLVALCWQLSKQWGTESFPLACDVAGEYLGVSKMTAWRMLKTLQFDGVIRVVKKGSNLTERASEYLFQGR